MVNYFNKNGKNGNGGEEVKNRKLKKQPTENESVIYSWVTGRVASLVYGVAGAYLVYWTGVLPVLTKKLYQEKEKLSQNSVSSASSNL